MVVLGQCIFFFFFVFSKRKIRKTNLFVLFVFKKSDLAYLMKLHNISFDFYTTSLGVVEDHSDLDFYTKAFDEDKKRKVTLKNNQTIIYLL